MVRAGRAGAPAEGRSQPTLIGWVSAGLVGPRGRVWSCACRVRRASENARGRGRPGRTRAPPRPARPPNAPARPHPAPKARTHTPLPPRRRPPPPKVLEPKDGRAIGKDWDDLGSEIGNLPLLADDDQPLPTNVMYPGTSNFWRNDDFDGSGEEEEDE